MQSQVDYSMNELKFGLEKIEEVEALTKEVVSNQSDLEKLLKKSARLSVCLCNLGTLITEFGPQRKINSLAEIERRKVLDPEDIIEKIFIVPKKRFHRVLSMEDEDYSP